MAQNNTIQTVGGFNPTFTHHLLNAGGQFSLKGFKLEDVFVHTDQLMDNSKMIPLVDGGVCVITNAMLAGRITINCLRVGLSTLDPGCMYGDLILAANFLQAVGDSYGGTLALNYTVNGNPVQIQFLGVTVARCPPAIIAGNDLPVYPVVLNYCSYTRM